MSRTYFFEKSRTRLDPGNLRQMALRMRRNHCQELIRADFTERCLLNASAPICVVLSIHAIERSRCLRKAFYLLPIGDPAVDDLNDAI